MNFIEFIKSNLEESDLYSLAQKLGYIQPEKGAARLKSLTLSPLLELDAQETYFDGVHGSRSIANLLLYEFHADELMISQALQSMDEITAFTEKCKADRSFMHISTNINYRSEHGSPHWHLNALSPLNTIRQISWLYNKHPIIQTRALSDIICTHYRKAPSKLSVFTHIHITAYHFHYRHDLPPVDFNVDGSLTGAIPEIDCRQLIMDGRDIAPIIRSSVEAMSDKHCKDC